MSIFRMCVSISLLAGAVVSAAPVPDWPMPYQNASLTRRLDAKGATVAPAVLWKKYLGGQDPQVLVQDVDVDTDLDVVLLVGGRAVCRAPTDGALLWASPALQLGGFFLDASGKAPDLNGDGVPDLLVTKAPIGDTRLYALDGRTGAIEWTFGKGLGPTSGVNGQNRAVIADIDGDPAPEVVLYVPSNAGGATVWAFDFAKGFGGEPIVWKSTDFAYNGNIQLSLADVTAGAGLEVVLAAGDVLHVLDAKTGATLGKTAAWHGVAGTIPYGTLLAPVQADSDAKAELFGAYQGATRFFGVWGVGEGGTSGAHFVHATTHVMKLPERQHDLDGDGLTDVVASIFDEKGDGHWWTSVYDMTGAEVATLDDLVVAGEPVDVDGDGRREIVLHVASGETLDPLAGLMVADWDGATIVPKWLAPLEGAGVAGAASFGGAPALLAYRDASGDGVRDTLSIVDASQGAPIVTRSYVYPKGIDVSFKATDDYLVAAKGEVLVFSSDGYLDVLATDTLDMAKLTPVSARLPSGGYAPPVLVSALAPGGKTLALVRRSTGRLARLDVAAGTITSDPPEGTIWSDGTGRHLLAVVDVDADESRELFAYESLAGVYSFLLANADGSIRWKTSLPGATGGVAADAAGAGADLNGDDVLDFYVMTGIGGLLVGVPLSGKDGAPLGWTWTPYQTGSGPGTAYSPAVFADVDGDSLADVIVSHYLDKQAGNASANDPKLAAAIHVLKGTDGSTITSSAISVGPHRVVAADLDGDPSTFDILVTWWQGRGALRPAPGEVTAALWSQVSTGPITRGMPIALDLDGDAKDDLLHFDHSIGRLRAARGIDGAPLWPGGGTMVDGERQLAGGRIFAPLVNGGFVDIETGAVVDDVGPSNLGERPIAITDLTGLGHPSALYAGGDGVIYCVNAVSGTLDWVYDMGFAIGSLAAADTDGDSLTEVLVTAEDGYLYAITAAADVGTIKEVRDGVAADVDDVTSAATGITASGFSANWDAAAGGGETPKGYLVRLVTDTGAVVVDWQDAGIDQKIAATGFGVLTPGVTYRVLVLPYGEKAGGRVFKSDGFRLLDKDGDGVMDGDEERLGTDPNNPDSDGDGIGDNAETKGGQEIDTDGDGTIDALDLDSDGDGLPDAEEGTADPDGDGVGAWRDADDDDDGISTKEEIADGKIFGSDVDGDGIPNWHDTDSDGDGASDFAEGTHDVDGDAIPDYLDTSVGEPPPRAPGTSGAVTSTGEATTRAADADCAAADGPGEARAAVLLALLLLLAIRRRAASAS